jgi:Ricin-type beta-trefoil lectin domain.
MKRFAVISAVLIGIGLSVLPAVPAQARPADEPMVIQAQTGTNQAVDVRYALKSSKAVIQTHSVNGTPAQSFTFANCDADGWCELMNTSTRMCLTVKGASTARGALVQQAACTFSAAQRWRRVSVTGDIYNLQSAIGSNRWLAVRDSTAKNGSRLRVWTHSTSKSQQFRFVAAPNWKVAFSHPDQTTKVTTSVSDLASLSGNWATDLVLTAKLKYGSKTMRTVTYTKKLSTIDAGGTFTWDVGDYGSWTITGEFRKGRTKVRSLASTSLAVTASEYIIAPITATMPVTMLTTSLWGSGSVRGDDHSIPVIVQMTRAGQWDWTKLPEGVHTLPYLSKADAVARTGSTYLRGHLTQMRDYIKDLVKLDPDSVIHLYVNDVELRMVQTLIYANKIPAANYTLTLLSDGGFSYQRFASTYTTADPAATHTTLVEEWNASKDYAYRTGKVSSTMTTDRARDYVWAAVKSEPTARWWLTRPSLLIPGTPNSLTSFATAASTDSQVVSVAINTKLNAIKAAGADALAEFRALYKFSDAYFAKSAVSGKKVMMFLGTRLTGEASFTDYASFTMKYYGTTYDYYYKGHPATPTPFYPDKVAQLKALKIDDVDSSVPAELILFFNPTIYMSGYPSTTYISVTDPDMAKGLFGLTKAQGLASTSPSYSIMKWFMAPKSSYTGAIAALPGDFVVEFSDAVAAEKGYDLAMWGSANQTITYYKLVDGNYQTVAG